MKKIIIPLILIAVIVSYLLIQFSRRQTEERKDTVDVSGVIECEEVRVGSKEGGRVAEVLVSEGDTVNAGQAMVRLESATLDAMIDESRAAERLAGARLSMLENGATAEEIQAAQAVVDAQKQQVAMLEHGATTEEIQAAQAGVAAQRQQVALLQRGTRREQIDAARADWSAAREQYENLRGSYQRLSRMYDAGVAARQTVDNAQTAMNAAEERAKAARATYDMALNGPRPEEIATARNKLAQGDAELRRIRKGPRPEEKSAAKSILAQSDAQLRRIRNGSRPEEIAQARATLDQARAKTRTLKTRLAEMTIRAPAHSVVESLDLYPGDLVAPAEEVARLVLSDKLWVRVFVPEDRLGFVMPGARAKVFVDSFPNKAFRGTVSRVARKAEFTPRNVQTPEGRASQVFRTKIIIDNADGSLRAGMTAIVSLPKKRR